MTTVDTPETSSRSFRIWSKSVLRLSFAASAASVGGTIVVALILALAHTAVTGTRQESGLADFGPWKIALPSETGILLVLAIIMLTLASLVQTTLRRVDALIVRKRLRILISNSTGNVPLNQRDLLAERYLLEGWTGWLSNTIQASGYSLLLAWIGGPVEWLGMLLAISISAVIAVQFFYRASDASKAFFLSQAKARDVEVRGRKQENTPSSEDVRGAMTGVSDAVFRRDTEVFRLPVVLSTLLSIGILVSAIVPAVFTQSESALPLFLIVLIIWRQRVMDAVSSVGVFAWTLTLWRKAGLDEIQSEAILD